MGEAVYEVIEPRPVAAKRVVGAEVVATDLNYAVVGQIWDYVFRGDEMFAVIEEKLTERFPGIRFVHFAEFGDIHGPDEVAVLADLPQRLRDHRVTAVVAGVGA